MISNLRVTIKLEYTCINSCVLNTLWLTEIWARRLSPARDILFSSKPLYPLLSPFYQIQCLIVAVHSELWLASSMSPDLHTELWLAGVCYWLCPGCWLLGATFPPPRLRHTTQTVSGGHPDPGHTPQMLPILSTHRAEDQCKVEQLHTLLTMSHKINSVFCTMVLYHFWWIETFCWEDNFCQPSDLQNYMSVTSNVFKTSASFHNAQHWQLMKIKIKWKN